MGDPITLLIYLCIFAVVVYLIFYILGLLPIPAPARTIIVVLVALILLLWLLRYLGIFP